MTRNILFVRGELKTALKALGKPVIVDGDPVPALPYYHLRTVSDPSVGDWGGEAYRVGRLQVDSYAARDDVCAAMDDAACSLLEGLGWRRLTGSPLPPEGTARRVYSDFTNEH